METLKWGIIGPGNIAKAFIDDLCLVTECANKVTAVMSHDLQDAKKFSESHHIPAYFDSIQEMLETTPPDIVYIATPHSAHYRQSMECLRHGVPVLCEKPFVLNEKQARELTALSHAKETFLMEGMWIRFLPSICKVLELLSGNVIGKINSIVADMSYRAPEKEENRFYNPDLGGGSLLDLGIYPVYLALLILGKPEKIKATAILSKDHIDESCAMILEYKNGAYALLESSIIKDTDQQARLYGEKGYITILKPWNEQPAGIVVSLYDGTSQHHTCGWPGRGFQFEVAEVVRCLSAHRLESDQYSHADSLLLAQTLNEIRHLTGVTYPLYE